MKTITIIGAGLGGLTSGALLAQKGYKVTILEQHNIVGGCATTFKRKGGFTCEVGLHEMDSVFDDALKAEIFNTLGVYDNVEFVRPDEFFRVSSDSIDFIMPDNEEEAIDVLSKRYPSQKAGIERYFRLIGDVSEEFFKLSNASWWQYMLFPFLFRNILRYRTATVAKVMDTLFTNEELKLLLNANVGYYSDKISTFSFLFHAIAQHSYYKGGGWYIKGGSQKLSDYLASVIEKHGGEIKLKSNVIKIDDKRVIYEHKKERSEIESDIIISNLATEMTYALTNTPYREKLEPAESLLTVYIGFKKSLKSIYGKQAYSTFLIGDVTDIDKYDKAMQQKIEDRLFVFVDYSQIDSGLTKDPNKSFAAVCTTDYLSDWEGLSKEEYKNKKEKVMQNILDKLEVSYPNIKEHIEFSEVATAKTVQRYVKTPLGTVYGFAPSAKQFFRVPQIKSKKVKDLYFVGAWVIGGGFTPAILSGQMCANEIIKSYPLYK